MIDDKLTILTEMKKVWADLTIEHIGDLVNYDLPVLLGAFKAGHAQ